MRFTYHAAEKDSKVTVMSEIEAIQPSPQVTVLRWSSEDIAESVCVAIHNRGGLALLRADMGVKYSDLADIITEFDIEDRLGEQFLQEFRRNLFRATPEMVAGWLARAETDASHEGELTWGVQP